jgi:hypothetical protein
MNHQNYTEVRNDSEAVSIVEIPILGYSAFFDVISDLLNNPSAHCISYFCQPFSDRLSFTCCIADDETGNIRIMSHETRQGDLPLKSLAGLFPFMHIYERKIH